MTTSDADAPALHREVGLGGAVLLGLGSMVGTGVFVSIGLAAGVAGPSLVAATLLAALVATANGLSSAQLAAAHPVSGGTYEYGYRWLSPSWGFSAGWMFLLAKSASAATAALGLAGYVLPLIGVEGAFWRTGAAVLAALAVTAFVSGGIRRSSRGNAVVVGVTLGVLMLLVLASAPTVLREGAERFTPFLTGGGDRGGDEGPRGLSGLFHGAALMFVAFTGYGRIATLGEEVREPRRTIPLAVVVTMAVVSLLYLAVAAAGIGVLGADAFGRAAERTAAPLEAVAGALERPALAVALAVGAVTAMTGVLLNLVLGLSRVVLAMARRGDAPGFLQRVEEERGSPVPAVWASGLAVAAIALFGDVRMTWSFSAFTVLLYYGITNLAALRLPAADRIYPRWIPVMGLTACVGLAFRVDPWIWGAGLALLGLGLAARSLGRARSGGAQAG